MSVKLDINDNIWIITDGNSHDDLVTYSIMLKIIPNIKGVVISGNGFASSGSSLITFKNYARMAGRCNIPVYMGSFISLFDEKNDYQGTYTTIVRGEQLMYSDFAFGWYRLIDNDQPVKILRDFESAFRKTKSPVVFALGPLTDVSKIADHAKKIYVLGGSFNPEDISEITPSSKRRVNPFASSNLYLDPLAAQKVLEIAGERTYWLFSSASRSIDINDETLKIIKRLVNDENKFSMKMIIAIYKFMLENDIAYFINDVSLLIVALFPKTITNITRERITIGNETSLTDTLDRENAEYTICTTYSLGIGGFNRREDGYLTNLIQKVNQDKVIDKYYELLCLPDDYFCRLIHEKESEKECVKYDTCSESDDYECCECCDDFNCKYG